MTWNQIISKVSIGSILDLKVQSKNRESKSVYFEFYGIEAVLPNNEIANNYELSFALFNAIRIGETISLVLVEIDENLKKLIFSTKVFRNALDDILSFTKCKNLIESNRKTHLGIDAKFLKQNRNILERLRGDLSSNELTFLYELIQNAVDHSNRNFNNNVSITFEVFNNYLLVKHNGALFTENNFESITGILYGEQIQEGEKNRIGYKGIGFKSVFRFTDNAYIRSGNFSFCFSKTISGADKPWEVLPVFQLEKDIVNKIPQFEFFNSPVAFAFEFNSDKNKNDVIKYLNQLSKNPYLLIFLDNLTQLTIKAPSMTYLEKDEVIQLDQLEVTFVKEFVENENLDSIRLLTNNEIHSDWIVYSKDDLSITNQEVVIELADESNTAIPSKMRNFRTPRITIALPKHNLEDDTINLFTYLPLSNTKYKLPFLVNADFIPDLGRTDIIQNLRYNKEVLRFVAITLKELTQKLSDNKQFNYLNTIIPDLNFEYQSSSHVIVEQLLDILPAIRIENNGIKLLISNVGTDKCDFSKHFEMNTYSELIDSVNIPINELQSYDKICSLIQKVNPTGILDFIKLKEKIRQEPFKKWLKNVNNNIRFLQFLQFKSYLEVFKDESIFLAEDGELYNCNSIYLDLGNDYDLLNWLKYKKVLNSSLKSISNNLDLPLKVYSPISFIKEIICIECKSALLDKFNSEPKSILDFYLYLSKHSGDQLFPFQLIKEFPIVVTEGKLPNWNFTIFSETSELKILKENNAFPKGIYYTLDDSWNESINEGMAKLAESLGVKKFTSTETYNFFKTIIVANREKISSYYNTSNIDFKCNLTLWSFILKSFDNLSSIQIDELKSNLKLLPVLSKGNIYKELNKMYLSFEYTDNDSLEKLAIQFQSANIEFVSAQYLNEVSIDKLKIRKLFKLLDVKEDSNDFLQHTLLPNLQLISEDLWIPLTRLIYVNRDSEPMIRAVLGNHIFRIKTKGGEYKPINQCYLGTPYLEENQISNALQSIPIIDQVSEEYSDQHFSAWRNFFADKLKIIQLVSEPEIITLKLKYINDNTEKYKQHDFSRNLIRDLYFLYKDGKLFLNETNLSYLKNIPLLSYGKESQYSLASTMHFGSSYKPVFDFESIFGKDCGLSFLDESYIFDDNSKLIQFFEQLGVTQYYEVNRHSPLTNNIPTLNGIKKHANQLYCYSLKKYVGEENVPFKDLSSIKFNGKSLEDYFGFSSHLSASVILNYISNSLPDRRELKELIIDFMKVFNHNKLEDRNTLSSFVLSSKLLSTAKTYSPISNLYSIDDTIRSGIHENEFLIDTLFNKNEQENKKNYLRLFQIKTLKIEDFNPHFEGGHVDNEFTNRVMERLVFLAFDFDSENYLEVEADYKNRFKEWSIKKCTKISLNYNSNNCLISKEDNRNFILPNIKVAYYIGNWVEQRNYILVDWLRNQILCIQKQLQFVQDILLNNPIDIIKEFENKGRNVPDELKKRFITVPASEQIVLSSNIDDNSNKEESKSNSSKSEENNEEKNEENKKDESNNAKFIDEVNEFILGLEESEWSEFIPELKSLLELSISHPKEKQKLFNLIAKLKLAKEVNIQFDIADKDYNHLESEDEKYFVHSARGAFAYIHPNEILKMRNEGYKMALDFSTKSRIKIYHTAEEILSLNTNHILAYQQKKTMDELFAFCEANRDKHKHLLIIDKDNSGEKSKALLKLLNIEDDYQ